ncbi:hypothetical protein BLA29_003365, partial [Euroglyphus maynei]
MFFVRNETAIQEFRHCQRQKNCRLQLQSFMYGTLNSRRCLKRSKNAMDMVESSYCKLIRARNLVATLFSVYENQSTFENRSVLMLTARLDSFTMFDSYSPGADSVYSAIIVMIAIVNTLNRNQHLIQTNRSGNSIKNILYAFFDGESMGHIGSNSWIFYNNFMVIFTILINYFHLSSNFIYLLSPNEQDDSNYGSILTSKIKLKSIKEAIELNQLIGGLKDGEAEYFIHSDNPNSIDDDGSSTIANRFFRFCKRNKFAVSNSRPLPSSSTVKQFRRYDPNIDALLMASYESDIRNPFFHSLFDSGHHYDMTIIIERLHFIADLVVNFIFEILTEQEYSKYQLRSDKNLVRNLVDCFIGLVPTCHLFDSTLNISGVQFEFTAPIQRETDMMMNTIETKSSHIKQRMQLNIDVKRSLQVILFYANAKLANCSSLPSTMLDDGFTILPLGHNQTYFDRDYRSGYRHCLASQTAMEMSESTYAEYMGKGLLLLADDVEMLRQRMDQLMTMSGVQFSSWTESNYHKNPAYRPVIRIFIEQSDWIGMLSFVIGIIITGFSIWIIRLIEQNVENFFHQLKDGGRVVAHEIRTLSTTMSCK